MDPTTAKGDGDGGGEGVLKEYRTKGESLGDSSWEKHLARQGKKHWGYYLRCSTHSWPSLLS